MPSEGYRIFRARVVSMPSTDVFLRQDAAYRESVLPRKLKKRLAVEAGVSIYWRAFTGDEGEVIGIDTYGESAPLAAVMKPGGSAGSVDEVVPRGAYLTDCTARSTSAGLLTHGMWAPWTPVSR